MIPPPPPDPALPALATALDGAAIGEVLDQHLPDCTAGGLRVESCRPCYVRYKPGTGCLVGYDLTLRETGTGATIALPAHARLYADGRGERLSASRALDRLAERAARRHPGPPAGRVAYLPGLGALVQIYPVDRYLPALVRATSAGKMRRTLGDALPHETGRSLALRGPELVRYKPGRKALLRYRLPGSEPGVLYGKLHADERGAVLFDAGRALAAAGVPAPAPLAYLADLRLLLHPEVGGRPLTELRGGAEFGRWMAPIAETLGRLHGTRLDSLSVHSHRDEADVILASGRAVGALLPGLRLLTDRLAARLAAHLAGVVASPATVHGDFYDDQVLVAGAEPVLLDFDEVRRGHPLLDVGNFLAHLSAAAGEGAASLHAARVPFLDAYAAMRPDAHEAAPLFEAAALLKLAVGPFRRLEVDWPEGIERLVLLSERRLQEYEHPAPVPVPALAADPALPQLRTLRDPAMMAEEFGRRVYKGPVAVAGIVIVRHKPGRRCLLRYDLAVGPAGGERPERLYAKTFASERGPRVYEIIRMVAAARACGPDIRLPDPVGYLPALKLLLQREVPGLPLAPVFLGPDAVEAERVVVRVAGALHTLHTAGLDLGRRHDLDKELGPLGDRVDRLAQACAALAVPARRCLALIEAGAERAVSGGWRWRPIHRDFYHDQLLIGEHGLSVLDFDDAAMSEPAIDVANFLAHLRLLALQQTEAPATLAGVAAAFEGRYRQLDPDLTPALLRFLEGATLLRLAQIHLPRERGEWLAGQLLAECERLLAPRS